MNYQSQKEQYQFTEQLYKQPLDKFCIYKVDTGNCYDSVIERNLNQRLPPQVSYITDKDVIGKKANKVGQQEESDDETGNKEALKEIVHKFIEY